MRNKLTSSLSKIIFCGFSLIGSSQGAFAVTAQQVFPDGVDSFPINGVQVRKGTIATTMSNIVAYESAQTLDERAVLARSLQDLLPSLIALDVFTTYPLDFWLSKRTAAGTVSLGHRLLGVIYAQSLVSGVRNSLYSQAINDLGGEKMVLNILTGASSYCTSQGYCATRPETFLANGVDATSRVNAQGTPVTIRKGTVASFLLNLKLLEPHLKNSEVVNNPVASELISNIASLLPALEALNFFTIFGVDAELVAGSPVSRALLLTEQLRGH